MPLSTLMSMLAAVAAQAAAPPPSNMVTVTGRGGVPFISPMGEPFRARTPNEDALARWFAQADINHDGYLTPDEMQADAARFFPELDANQDGEIDPDEIVRYEWQIAPEIQVNSKLRRPRGNPVDKAKAEDADTSRTGPMGPQGRGDRERGPQGRGNRFDPMDQGPQGAGRYALLNMPEPVAAADADFNRSITLEEFRQAALARFKLLDKNNLGRLSLADLEALKPILPEPGRKMKRPKNEADTRIAVPLPLEPNAPSN